MEKEIKISDIKESEMIVELLQKWVITREQADKALSKFNLII